MRAAFLSFVLGVGLAGCAPFVTEEGTGGAGGRSSTASSSAGGVVPASARTPVPASAPTPVPADPYGDAVATFSRAMSCPIDRIVAGSRAA
jgi:hypothetical protein